MLAEKAASEKETLAAQLRVEQATNARDSTFVNNIYEEMQSLQLNAAKVYQIIVKTAPASTPVEELEEELGSVLLSEAAERRVPIA